MIILHSPYTQLEMFSIHDVLLFTCTKKLTITGFSILQLYTMYVSPDISMVLYMHNFKTHFSPPLNHYSNRQTVNPMAAVGLMCRLLPDPYCYH